MKKKFFSALLALLVIFSLASCESTDGMTEYKNDELGVAYKLSDELMPYPYGSYSNQLTYKNLDETYAAVLSYYTVESLVPYIGEDFTLEEYMEYSFKKNGIDTSVIPIEYNKAKSRASFAIATGEDEADEPQYIYSVVVIGNAKVFVLQLICSASDSESYLPEFRVSGNSLYTY